MNVRPLVPNDADACDAVLATLPYFFGDPDGIAECARAVRTQRGWVVEEEGEVVAFVTIDVIFSETVEITSLAVRDLLPVKEVQLRDWNSDSAILLALMLTESTRARSP